MKGRLLLNIVVGQSTTIFQLFTGKDQTLLIWRNTFLVLNLSLNVFNSIGWFDLQCNGFTSQSFNENLHTTTKTQDQMKGRFLLDIVVGQSTTIFQLFTGKDQTLLVWGNTFLVLNLSLNILNGIRRFNLQCNCFSR
uniref:Putative ubiquitin/40s ribosomal protein s27a fusion n=1 Tax=Haematobia irritans TaxID=7368 RepID=A0A1L8E847_HAEIR